MGHIFNSQGMRPDEEKIRAITQLKEPTNKVELQRIMGMINYLRNFIPNLANITAPWRELLKKDKIFMWLPVHSETFKQIKQIISSPPTLGIFDD